MKTKQEQTSARPGVPFVGEIWDAFFDGEEGRYMHCITKRHVWHRQGFLAEISAGDMNTLQRIIPHRWVKTEENTRTWLLLSNTHPEIKKFLIGALNDSGKQLESFEGKGVSLYLYDLSGKN